MAQWFWRRRFFAFRRYFFDIFSLLQNYLPLEKGRPLHLIKLDSPLPKDALCQIWLKLAQRFWRSRFLNSVNILSLFHNYLPLENGRALHLIKLESPSPKDTLSAVWLKLSKLCWRRRFFNFVNVFSLFLKYLPLEKSGSFI